MKLDPKFYSNSYELEKSISDNSLSLHGGITDPTVPLDKIPTYEEIMGDIPKEQLGEFVAELVARYGGRGYVPTFEEYQAYNDFVSNKQVSAWKTIGDAVSAAASDFASGTANLVGDVATLKVQKVAGSAIEGAVLGTKNWYYMYQQAKYDKNSWLSRALFNNHDTIEDSYLAFQNALEVRREIEKDQTEGIFIPPSIKVGGMDIDLTNPHVVQMVSYVADPSWLVPNLGVEATIAKALRGVASGVTLGEKLSLAAGYAAKKASVGFGKLADSAETVSSAIKKADDSISTFFTDMTGHDHNVTVGGQVLAQEGIVRASESALGVNQVKVPAWGLTTGVWGSAKLIEGVARLGEVATKLMGEEPVIAGTTLSERIAAESTSPSIKKFASFWSRGASPFVSWASNTTKTALHSSMYGGAFGLALGGEEGMYHGLGTGFVIGSAFHQVGALANTVSGADAVRDTVKHFLWATSHYDRHNQEGVLRLLENVKAVGGETAQLRTMGQIAASERLLRDTKMLILTEDKIREMATGPEWEAYQRDILENADFGGVTFLKGTDGKEILIINADRAVQSAVSEELFHGLMVNSRYKKAFQKHALDSLVGTEDNKGALYRIPREQAVRVLENFRDQYFNLDKSTGKFDAGAAEMNIKKFNEAIEMFRNGEKPTVIKDFLEEFLASYWNRYIEEKPIDYLIKGGDLGLIRNAIEGAKGIYRNIMASDLKEAGVQLADANGNPDLFLIDQNTKQRVRVPMLEKMMRKMTKEINDKMYDGWEINEKKYANTDQMMLGELDHLTREQNGTTVFIPKETLDAEHSNNVSGMIDELLGLREEGKPYEGLRIKLVNEANQETAQFSKGKPTKKTKEWFEEEAARTRGTGVTEAQLRGMGGKPPKDGRPVPKKEQEVVEYEVGEGRWSREYKDGFWQSAWQGNPRIVLQGIATPKELQIIEKWLGVNTAKRFRELNAVIELARTGKLENISNIVKANVITHSREKEGGGREFGNFVNAREFIPLEVEIYFERTPVGKPKNGVQKYRMGNARMTALVFDWEAYLTRENYLFNKINDGDLNFRTVQRLFKSKANLRDAVRLMLTNYSLGNRAEAGIKLFNRGSGGERDAALKRDIVNAAIGFHPTKEQLMKRQYKNEPRDMQLRRDDKKRSVPSTVTSFRVDRMSKILALEGEGFKMDFEKAYPRGQANFSPAFGHRDNYGRNVPASVRHAVRNTVYRNREGELISVYPLRTPNSELRVNRAVSKVFEYTDNDLGVNLAAMLPSIRGNQYSSPNGWLHFTPDMYESAFFEKDTMRKGYIDTTRHIDISDVPFYGKISYSVEGVAKAISDVSGSSMTDVMKDILMMRDNNGKLLFSSYKNDKSLIDGENINLENWLFTDGGRKLLRKYNIESVGYKNTNQITGGDYSAIAIIDSYRFVENKDLDNLNSVMFSPAKNVQERFIERVNESLDAKDEPYDIVRAMLPKRIDSEGRVQGRGSRNRPITEADVNKIIAESQSVYDSSREWLRKNNSFSDKNRSKWVSAVKPLVVSELRKKFKFAPVHVLEQIADYSLNGFVEYFTYELGNNPQKPFGRTTEVFPKKSLIADSALIESASKYGITPEKLKETGLFSLGHWVEMSEAEYTFLKAKYVQPMAVKGVKDYEIREVKRDLKADGIPFGSKKGMEMLSDENINQLVRQSVLRNYKDSNEIVGDIASRQKQLVFLMDASISGTGGFGNDNINLSSVARSKLAKLFVERNRGLMEKLGSLARGSNGKKIVNEFMAVADNLHNISERGVMYGVDEVKADFHDAEFRARNIIANDAKNQILDFLASYQLTNIDNNVLESVRARMYDMASKGQLSLGTPEAIATAVRLYASLSQDNLKQVMGVRDSIQRNYIESLTKLEEAGFLGINWVSRETADGKVKIYNPDGSFKTIKAEKYFVFDGIPYKAVLVRGSDVDINTFRDTVIEGKKQSVAELVNDVRSDKFLILYGENGEILLRNRIKADDKLDINPAIEEMDTKMFLRQATQIVRRHIEQGILPQESLIGSDRFQIVEGNIKNIILRIGLNENKVTGGQEFDLSKYELYRNGDHFVAVTKNTLIDKKFIEEDKSFWDSHGIKFEDRDNIPLIIERFKQALESGTVKEGRKTKILNLNDKARLREYITKFEGRRSENLGFAFTLDHRYRAKIIEPKFTNLTHRNHVLRELGLGHMKNKAFEKAVEEKFLQLEQHLVKFRNKQLKRLEQIVSDSDPKGSIAQIKTLVSRLNELEAQREKFLGQKARELNASLKSKGKKPVEAKKVAQELIDVLSSLNNPDNVNSIPYQEAMYYAAARQLSRMGVLETMGLAPEVIRSIESGIAYKESSVDLSVYETKFDGSSNPQQVIGEIQRKFSESEAKMRRFVQTFETLHKGIFGNSEEMMAIKDKIEFLSKRYLEAKGISTTSDLTKLYTANSEIRVFTGFDEGGIVTFDGRTKFNYDALRFFSKGKDIQPRYLPDSDNILGKGYETAVTETQISESFKSGIIEYRNAWDKGGKNISLEEVLNLGSLDAGTEINISDELRQRIDDSLTLSGDETTWTLDPKNKKKVESIDKKLVNGVLTQEEAIAAIKNEYMLEKLSPTGVEFVKTHRAIEDASRKIGIVAMQLNAKHRAITLTAREEADLGYQASLRDASTQNAEFQSLLAYSASIPKGIKQLEKELQRLRNLRDSLTERMQKLMSRAGDINGTAEFKQLVAEYNQMTATKRAAAISYRQERQKYKEFERLRKMETRKLFQRYDDIAKNLGYESSRIPVNPADPKTQMVAYAFPEVTMDIFGKSWRRYDINHTTHGNSSGTVVENGLPSAGASNQNLSTVYRNEGALRRTAYLADYIHLANAKLQYHLKNPSEPMTAHDAKIIQTFFPAEYTLKSIQEKVRKIPADKMETAESFRNGIIDRFTSNEERERFVRSFVRDALDLISKDESVRTMGLRKLLSKNNKEAAEFDKIVETDPSFIKERANTIEAFEAAMYMVRDKFLGGGYIRAGTAGEPLGWSGPTRKVSAEDRAWLSKLANERDKKGKKIRNWSEQQIDDWIKRAHEGNVPREILQVVTKGKEMFRTRTDIGYVPIDTLVRMTGFDDIWKSELKNYTETSLWGIERMFGVKAQYESLSASERMQIGGPKVKRLMLENEAQNIKQSREVIKRYKNANKAILEEDTLKSYKFGLHDSLIKDEEARVMHILSTAAPTAASIVRYKGDVTTFISNRPFAVENLLSLNDNLRITDAVIRKNREVEIDWNNPDKPQFRDTIDGRYFILRELNKKGEESFKVVFKGETFETVSKKKVYEIPMSEIATVSDLTQAQVMIRFFDDDVMRVKKASELIQGGRGEFDPYRVGEKMLPLTDVNGPLLASWGKADLFSEKILQMYKENGGKPYFSEELASTLEGIGQYGEMVYLQIDRDGKVIKKKRVVTPKKEGILSKYFEKRISPDGHTIYYRKTKPNEVNPDTAPVDKETASVNTATPKDIPAPSPVEQKVSDASTFDITQSKQPTPDSPNSEWTVMTNRLGYTIIKLDAQGTKVYRLFNPMSALMAETYSEIEAVEEILKKELEGLDE